MKKFKDEVLEDINDYDTAFDKMIKSYRINDRNYKIDTLFNELNDLFDMLNDNSPIAKKYIKKRSSDDLLSIMFNNIVIIKELLSKNFTE